MTAVLTDRDRWRAVVARDRRARSAFVYAVRSTGIYCRAGCPSRRPRRDQVEFFPEPSAAESAGYRACKRCRPLAEPRDERVELVARVCRVLDESPSPVPLADLGRRFGVSPGHLQRVFTKVTGVSPRAYHDTRRERRLRDGLRAGAEVSRALYEAGYGSPSRVYERTDRSMGMTPASYRAGGEGAVIGYATAPSPLGRVLVAATDKGLCFVCLGASDAAVVRALGEEFPAATRRRDQDRLGDYLAEVVARVSGDGPHRDLPLDVRATAFQRKVWEALTRIPPGETVSYAQLARRIGRPRAVRAVAGACAGNNVAVVIPCHRVVRTDGGLGGYRGGVERKRRLLESERAAG